MKRILSLLTALCLSLVFFTACGDDDGGSGGHGSAEASAYALLDAINSRSPEAILNASLSPTFVSAMEDKAPSSYKEYVETSQSVIDELIKYYGNDFVLSGDITSQSDLSESKVEKWQTKISKLCKACGLNDYKVLAGSTVKFKYTASGSKGSRERSGSLTSLNIEGLGWYAVDFDY